MDYITINNVNLSPYCSGFGYKLIKNYEAQTNAAGDTLVDMRSKKAELTCTIIPLDEATAQTILNAVDGEELQATFRNPKTNQLETISAFVSDYEINYYSFTTGIRYKEFTLTISEL